MCFVTHCSQFTRLYDHSGLERLDYSALPPAAVAFSSLLPMSEVSGSVSLESTYNGQARARTPASYFKQRFTALVAIGLQGD